MSDALVGRMAEALINACRVRWGLPPVTLSDVSEAHRIQEMDNARAALAVAEPDIATLRAERNALAARVEVLVEAMKWLAADSIDPDSRRIARAALEPRE